MKLSLLIIATVKYHYPNSVEQRYSTEVNSLATC